MRVCWVFFPIIWICSAWNSKIYKLIIIHYALLEIYKNLYIFSNWIIPNPSSMDIIYIYIYIYLMLSTDRLSHCITTLQCSKIREKLQAGIETRLVLKQSDILPQKHCYSLRYWKKFFTYNFLHIRYRLPGVLISCRKPSVKRSGAALSWLSIK